MIAQLPGFQLGYEDSGDGLPLLMLHGFPHDRTLWTQQRRSLSARVRCIAPDLRGFGHSSTHGPYSMDQYADDVITLLNWLEIDAAVVCGLSMGGYVAMALWRRYPDRIRALILCDTKATADTEETRLKRDELIVVARREGARVIAERQLTGMVGQSTRERRPDVISFIREMMARQTVAGIVGALRALRDREDSRETLRTVTVPTLVLVGEEDALTPVSDARAMAALLPAAARVRMEIIAGAGHASCVERPAATTHAVADFLTTLAVPV